MKESEILKLIKLLEESNIDEIEISKWWKFKKIKVSKHPSNQSNLNFPQKSELSLESKSEGDTNQEKLYHIKSPMVGTFYHAPAPDSQPYVRKGEVVKPNQVLCLVESMKLMNEIKSSVEGEVVDILVKNAQPVEYNQTLFLIRRK